MAQPDLHSGTANGIMNSLHAEDWGVKANE